MTDVARNKSGRFFCSALCVGMAGGTKPRKGSEKACLTCGKSIYVRPGDGGRTKTCSRQCHTEWQARNAVRCVCESCGKEYRISKSQAGWRKARWCSKRCEGDARLKRPLDRLHNGRRARLDNAGYVMVYEPEHPKAIGGGWVLEHRLVMEQLIGRYLDRREVVHHINGNRADNRLENLQVLSPEEHNRITGRTNWAELQRYRERFGPLE